MAAVTENDLKELKDLIIAFREDTNNRLTKLEEGQQVLQLEIKTRLSVIEARLDEWRPAIAKIPDLAEKVGELKNWRQIVVIVVTATVSGVIGWLIRGGNQRF